MICTGVDQQAGIAHARNFPKPTFLHDAIERLGNPRMRNCSTVANRAGALTSAPVVANSASSRRSTCGHNEVRLQDLKSVIRKLDADTGSNLSAD
jgi:hypothetical protein